MKRLFITFTILFVSTLLSRVFSQEQAKNTQPTTINSSTIVETDTIWIANLNNLDFADSIDSLVVELKNSNAQKRKNTDQVFFLILGAGLGIISTLASTFFIDWVKKKKQIKELKNAISIEIEEIRVFMTLIVSSLAIKFGFYDDNLLTWLKDKISNLENFEGKDISLQVVNRLIQGNDDQIEEFEQTNREYSASQIKHAKLPFLEANIAKLPVLGLSLQRKFLDIRTHVGFFNDSVDDSRHYLHMTFDTTLGDENHQIVKANLMDSYMAICNRAQIIVDKIDLLTE